MCFSIYIYICCKASGFDNADVPKVTVKEKAKADTLAKQFELREVSSGEVEIRASVV